MASYVYDPSKKVTELLSPYLEFDPAQLELAIWSGNLSLTNVHLRQEAIAPLLNSSSQAAAATTEMDRLGNGIKPPLKFKLVSGTIGSLSLKIPWKRLAFTQGEVKVDLRNVVIVLALQSSNDDDEDLEKELDSDSKDNNALFINEQDAEETEHLGTVFPRAKKQKIIREAEKRHLQGRTLGPWLSAMKKKEEDERRANHQSKTQETLDEKVGKAENWLKSFSNDFFWRLFVGLEMNVENVKIVVVQDGIEMGVIVPSSKVIAGKPGSKRDETPVDQGKPSDGPDTATGPSPKMDYDEGEHDEEGKHVDKQIRHLGIGVYVRKEQHHQFRSKPDKKSGAYHPPVPMDVHTSDYILRPVDVLFNFSLVFPLPPEKRKRKLRHVTADMLPTVPITDETVSSDNTSKRRRGKRDKSSPAESSTADTTTQPTVDSPSGMPKPKQGHVRQRTADQLRPLPILSSSSRLSSAPAIRRGSMLQGSMHRPDPVQHHHRRQSTAFTLPLAQPDDIEAVYSTTAKVDIESTRLDGKLSVGAVQMVCSTKHFQLMNLFLAAAAKMRNGRPTTTIQSVLDQKQALELLADEATIDDDSNSDTMQHNTETERVRVVRLWWRYVFGVMRWELRQRRRLRQIFQQQYLSFSWKRQSYKRSEYVNLYIAVRLSKSWNSASHVEELLEIEDKLTVEQILLYRSFARAIHVQGGNKMPDSILELQTEQAANRVDTIDDYQPSPRKEMNPSEDGQSADRSEVPNFLSVLDTRCEIARKRRDADDEDGAPLPGYGQLEKLYKIIGAYEAGVDAVSFGLASESKTAKSHKSGKSSVATTAMDAAHSRDTASSGMSIAFTADVEKLELMIVEDEELMTGYVSSDESLRSGGVSIDSDKLSEVSVLTDDERFFKDQGTSDLIPEESEHTVDPVFPSTDFLLFKRPEKIFLLLGITSLSFSAFSRSGGSRNLNFTIGEVTATGEKGVSLLAVGGTDESDEAPLSEIEYSGYRMAGLHTPTVNTPVDALSLSIVDKNKQNFVQCDTPIVRVWIDPVTIEKLMTFSSKKPALFPKQLLSRSPKEEVRLYVLQQNQASFSALNCSIRIHGCDIALPLKKEVATLDRHVPHCLESPFPDPSVVLRCDMIEMYSGSAVEELCAIMDSWRPSEDVASSLPTTLSRHPTDETRRLSMLDVPELVSMNANLLSSPRVS